MRSNKVLILGAAGSLARVAAEMLLTMHASGVKRLIVKLALSPTMAVRGSLGVSKP